METLENVQKHIRGILSLETVVPRPPASVCNSIEKMQDLIELHGHIKNEWRKGAPETGSPYRFSGDSSHNKRSNFKGGVDNNSKQPIKAFHTAGELVSGATPPPIPKYQSKFKNSTQPVDDKILNNIILSKLNKFSPKTYDEIRDFLYQILGSGEPDLQQMIRDFMKLVFKKAAIEEIFCPLYAKLLSEISSRYSVILQEMNFLQSNYLLIFDDVQESTSNNYNEFVETQKNKQYRLGYSQFLAELTALEILDVALLNSTFQKILKNMLTIGRQEDKKNLMDEYCDCLFRMAKVLKRKSGKFFIQARNTLYESNKEVIREFIEEHSKFPSETSKTRFILMDIRDILTE
jgi:hypothetical protein